MAPPGGEEPAAVRLEADCGNQAGRPSTRRLARGVAAGQGEVHDVRRPSTNLKFQRGSEHGSIALRQKLEQAIKNRPTKLD